VRKIMDNKLIWKGRTALFEPDYLTSIGLDVQTIKKEGWFEIESGDKKGVYRIHHIMRPEGTTKPGGTLYCKLFEKED
jgi:hypothetical protein